MGAQPPRAGRDRDRRPGRSGFGSPFVGDGSLTFGSPTFEDGSLTFVGDGSSGTPATPSNALAALLYGHPERGAIFAHVAEREHGAVEVHLARALRVGETSVVRGEERLVRVPAGGSARARA